MQDDNKAPNAVFLAPYFFEIRAFHRPVNWGNVCTALWVYSELNIIILTIITDIIRVIQ